MSNDRIMNRAVEMYCPDDEQEGMGAKKSMPGWVGQKHAHVQYPCFDDQEEVINLVGMIAVHAIEHMVRMGKTRWLVRLDIRFASRSLLEFYKELSVIPFPGTMSSIVACNEASKTAVLVFSNSKRLISIYKELLSCPCTDPDECPSCKHIQLAVVSMLSLNKREENNEENPGGGAI